MDSLGKVDSRGGRQAKEKGRKGTDSVLTARLRVYGQREGNAFAIVFFIEEFAEYVFFPFSPEDVYICIYFYIFSRSERNQVPYFTRPRFAAMAWYKNEATGCSQSRSTAVDFCWSSARP